jgi:hypothetical protein
MGDFRQCVKIWDYEAIFKDVVLCEDFSKDSQHVMLRIMQGGRGSMNPKEIKKRLDIIYKETV